MSAPPSKKQIFNCPNCGAKFEFGEKMAGRSAKCQRCGHLFAVPKFATSSDRAVEKNPEKRAAPAPPEFVGISCRVCQTRLAGRLSQVGQPITCPDCGAQTILKAPVPEKAKPSPAALQGEQYELWDADATPMPSELLAAQPKYIAVHCRLCGTLMHATEDQIGQEVSCPDCATRNLVVPPAQPKARREVLVSDAEAYQLDEDFAPTERPVVIQSQYKGMLYEQEHEAELASQAAEAARGKKPRTRTDVRGRAILPRWPLLTGIVPFLFSRGLPQRWLAMSIGLFLPSMMLIEGVIAWQTSSDPRAIFGGLVASLVACVALLLWLAAFSGMLVAIVAESSEGHDRVHVWPPLNFLDSMPELFCVLIAAAVSTSPGFIVGQVFGEATWQKAVCSLGSVWLLFPLVLLSQLAASSPWALLSGHLIGAAFRRPLSSLLCYLESACLFGASLTPIAATASIRPSVPVLFAPLMVAALFLYGRLLGRWGWLLAESSRPKETDDE
ncbi:MAG TPA: hypothetical protein VGM76_04575 [Lacipirellulaceae bacterium]|jgi:DNA-directed RNA polymerase subunit RPC12/RpoP